MIMSRYALQLEGLDQETNDLVRIEVTLVTAEPEHASVHRRRARGLSGAGERGPGTHVRTAGPIRVLSAPRFHPGRVVAGVQTACRRCRRPA